jgi:hypothetical protein
MAFGVGADGRLIPTGWEIGRREIGEAEEDTTVDSVVKLLARRALAEIARRLDAELTQRKVETAAATADTRSPDLDEDGPATSSGAGTVALAVQRRAGGGGNGRQR